MVATNDKASMKIKSSADKGLEELDDIANNRMALKGGDRRSKELQRFLKKRGENSLSIDKSHLPTLDTSMINDFKKIRTSPVKDKLDATIDDHRQESSTITKRVHSKWIYDKSAFKLPKFIEMGKTREEIEKEEEEEAIRRQQLLIEEFETGQVKRIAPSIYEKVYNFGALKKNYYNEIFKRIDYIKQTESHTFLDDLNNTEDNFAVFSFVPKSYRMMENVSNLINRDLITSDIVEESFPYLEFGDIAHRLVVGDKYFLTPHEQEMVISRYKDAEQINNIDSVHFARFIQGFEVKENYLNSKKAETAMFERFARNIGDNSFLDFVSEQAGVEQQRSHGTKKEPLPGERLRAAIQEFRNGQNKENIPPNKHMKFSSSHPVKFKQSYIEENRKTYRTLGTDPLVTKDSDLAQASEKILTEADFKSMYESAIESRQHLTVSTPTDHPLFLQHLQGVNQLFDLVISVLPSNPNLKNLPTLQSKVSVLMENIEDLKSMYISNIFAPDIVVFLLREYVFLKYRKDTEMPELKLEEEAPSKIRSAKEHNNYLQCINRLKLLCTQISIYYGDKKSKFIRPNTIL